MPELRKDPILDRWVIISEERGRRPLTVSDGDRRTDPAHCPFCPGHEGETEPEIAAHRDSESAPDSPGWRIRVVPNKYPALRSDAAPRDDGEALFQRRSGLGHHEVIIEGESHTRSVTELSPARMREVVVAYRERLLAMSRVPELRSAVIIKNVGLAAGASIEHSHSQLIATPVLPPVLRGELEAARSWAEGEGEGEEGECIWCRVIGEERARGDRTVEVGPSLVALCPFASRFPYETWILPLDHESHFEATPDASIEELGDLLPRVLRAIEACLGDPPFNYVIHSAPFPTEPHAHYHWHVAILPRVTRVAGYEQATGLYINPMSPERAAGELREHLHDRGD